jgi:hypothetical protein
VSGDGMRAIVFRIMLGSAGICGVVVALLAWVRP